MTPPTETNLKNHEDLTLLTYMQKEESLSLPKIKDILTTNPCQASLQDPQTGKSPLMISASQGNIEVCSYLLSQGAPWNAIDKHGKCAGNYAVDGNHQECIDLLVNHGVQSELILNSINKDQQASPDIITSTKPEYLSNHRLKYTNRELIDKDGDAVMMEWERPLMSAHASIITNNQKNKRVLNVGFGMGIIDSILQEYEPSLHVIIEAHPDVYNKILKDKWDTKPNVKIYFGKWQDVIPQLITENISFDGIFWDTYGEDFQLFQKWNSYIPSILSNHGTYSYFNGFCPDNVFFQGVISQIILLSLQGMGLKVDFYPCEIQVNSEEWKDVKREYWCNNTYYLPVVTWNDVEDS